MSFIDENTLFILDSYGLIYREYFAFVGRPLTNSKKENISAVFGFFRNLSTILKTFRPRYMVAAMDSLTPTFRHEMFSEYKATRQKTPDDLKAQFPWIEELLGTLGIPMLRKNGFEADDIIATLARKSAESGRKCVVLSADKDLMQLASNTVHIMRPDKAKVWAELDSAGVEADWGIPADKLLDLLSLMGDAADNVPGVSGVGKKTAVKLLSQFGSLESIYEHVDEIKGKLGEKIRADKENAFLSKKLITLETAVPLSDDDMKSTLAQLELDYAATAKKLGEFELPALEKTFRGLSSELGAGSGANREADDSELGGLFGQAESKKTEADEKSAPQMQETPPKTNVGSYKAITTAEELNALVDEAISRGLCAFDTETDSLNSLEANLVGFSISVEAGTGAYVPLILSDSFFQELVSKKDALDSLRRLFASETKIIMHNGKFDLKVLWTNGLDVLPKCFYDTMIAAWLLEPDRTGKTAYGLEYLAETKLFLRGTEFDEIVPKGKTFADVPLDEAKNYGSEDSDFTLQLWLLLEKKLRDADLWDLFENMEMKVLPILAEMERNGIHLNPKCLDDFGVELKKQLVSQEKDIFDVVGHEFNVASPKQLSEVLFVERGLKATKKTRTGYSTSEDVLEQLAAEDPVPRMILEYRSAAKLLSTYVQTLPTMLDADSRVHTTFMQTGTATGRLSSKDPNLQNIPVRSEEGRKIRLAFTAAPGKVLVSADYAQIELVVMAHLSGDKNLCDAFNNGIDVHKSTAALIYGIDGESVTAEQRRIAKTINFGVMYGMSAFRLANEIGISRTESKRFIDNYFSIYSGVKSFFDKNIALAEETGFVTTIFGRKRYIPQIRSQNKFEKEAAIRIAKNTPIQGSAADIVKKAMIRVSDALKKSDVKAKLLLQVHDELILECDDDEKSILRTEALLRDSMEKAVELSVPLKVSVETGASWGKFH